MEIRDFKEIAELINNATSVDIELAPTMSSKGLWSLYKGQYKVHGIEIPFEVLYLYSKASTEALIAASKDAFKRKETRVVFPPSLDQRIKAHREIFKDAKELLTTKEYLAQFLAEELKTYSTKLKSKKPIFYVDPRFVVPLGIKRKIPNLVIGALKEGRASGELIVLLAQPGQGKTFMSEHVVSFLAESGNGLFPIYINSEQWATMGPAEISSLWKTMTHSFRHLEAPISWVAGCEEVFIQTTLKAGIFCIIFDGFDEYILQNHGKVSAIETIKMLSDLVKETSARIAVTSRSSFWESEIASQMAEEDKSIVYSVYELCPFDSGLANSYFSARFDGDARTARATSLYSELLKEDEQFVGRGFTLSLIADLFSDKDEKATYTNQQSPLMWLMEALCARESRRQELPINSAEQIRCLSLFSAECLQGEEPTQMLLDYCIESVAPKLSTDARRACINNMAIHPLVNRQIGSEQWDFTQKQVNVTLIAQYLIDANGNELTHFADKASISDDFASDIATSIIHLVRSSGGEVKGLIERFLQPSNHLQAENIDSFDSLRKLAVLIALRWVDAAQLKSSKERSECLQNIFPNRELRLLPFSGAIARYDFSNTTFTRCKFNHVRWGNCKFSSNTVFDSCNFFGSGSANHCSDFGLADWRNTIADNDGQAFIDSLRIASGTKAYDLNDLKVDIDSILKKFFVAGGSGFKRVNVHHIKSGHISSSRFKDRIINGLSGHVIELISGPGTSEKSYYEVRASAIDAMHFYASNNVYIGDH